MTDKPDKPDDIIKKLTIRDVPARVHHKMKIEAVRRRLTLGELFTEIYDYWDETHKETEEK